MRHRAPASVRAAGLLLAFLLSAGISGTAGAQPNYLVNEPGTWKPWEFTATPTTRKERAAAPADVKAFEAELLKLQAVFRQAPGVANPVGFSVETWGNLHGYTAPVPGQPAGSTLPLAGALSFGAFPIFEYERSGKLLRTDTGETQLLLFHVNEIQPWLTMAGSVGEWGDIETDAFLMPPVLGQVAGFPRYGDVIVIKKNPASIWAPVSVEAALQLTRQAREQARQMRKDNAARDPSDGMAAAELQKAERALKEVDDLITSLPSSDRNAPACDNSGARTLRDRFRGGAAPGCVPIVRPNWQYFDRTLPRSAPQVVIVSYVSRCYDRPPDPRSGNTAAGCPANRRLLETMDRGAILSWLK